LDGQALIAVGQTRIALRSPDTMVAPGLVANYDLGRNE
jgi:hypothetical protein